LKKCKKVHVPSRNIVGSPLVPQKNTIRLMFLLKNHQEPIPPKINIRRTLLLSKIADMPLIPLENKVRRSMLHLKPHVEALVPPKKM
jgi:hypothetical protein